MISPLPIPGALTVTQEFHKRGGVSGSTLEWYEAGGGGVKGLGMRCQATTIHGGDEEDNILGIPRRGSDNGMLVLDGGNCIGSSHSEEGGND